MRLKSTGRGNFLLNWYSASLVFLWGLRGTSPPKFYSSVEPWTNLGQVQFLPRDSMHRRRLCRLYYLSVCPSVRLLVTFVCSVKMSRHIFNLVSLSDRPANRGVECRWGMKRWRFSTNISLHRVLSTVRSSGVVNVVPWDRGKLVTLIGGVCVQHSSEARVVVLPRDACHRYI